MPAETSHVYAKEAIRVAKYNEGRTPADGAPDDIVDVSQYYRVHADGTRYPVSDPDEIAEIERRIAAKHTEGV